MAFGEPTSAPRMAEPPPTADQPHPVEPPRSWTFDEDESWSPEPVEPTLAPPPEPPPPPPQVADPASSIGAVPASPTGAAVTGAFTAGAHAAVAHPARMVLGMASLAAQRLRGGTPAGDALTTGVGLLQETATGLRDFGRRVFEPASRLAADTVDRAVDRASTLPGAAIPVRSIALSRARLSKVVARARRRGEATVAAGRADAEAFVKSSVAETLTWAQAQAVPQIVDGLVPHLVDEVVPRLIEGAMPEIRAKLLPVVIDDLADSPQLRDLMMEQGKGVVGDAADHLRTTTATADDRVESAFRRMVRGGAQDEPAQERTPTDPSTPLAEGG
jgi:hypothetical protein